MTGALIAWIEKDLKLQWSPEQLSGRLKRKGTHISHETIYQRMGKDKTQGGALYIELPHHGKNITSKA